MIVKLAYDSDYDTGDRYGICANRELHQHHNLVTSLNSAMKDKNLDVSIEDMSGKQFAHKGDVGELLSSGKLHHRFDWSVDMSKNNKLFAKDKNKQSAILKYLSKTHGFQT